MPKKSKDKCVGDEDDIMEKMKRMAISQHKRSKVNKEYSEIHEPDIEKNKEHARQNTDTNKESNKNTDCLLYTSPSPRDS